VLPKTVRARQNAGVSSPAEKLDQLRTILACHARVVVAWSGGVDSTLLAVVAAGVLGDAALAVTAVSPSLPAAELDLIRELAGRHGVTWERVATAELDRPGYVANDTDRCYHCKSELFDVLAPIAAERGAVIAVGTIVDDLGEHRPGLVAASERGVRTPLLDAGFTKADVRAAAQGLGIDVWDKPAAPCLASRVPHGTPVTLGVLATVERAEQAVRTLGFRDLRVRHYGDLARIEVPAGDIDRLVARRDDVVAAVRAAGYRYVTLDLEGLRSGNLAAAAAAREV
jgi:uncharacterized protein